MRKCHNCFKMKNLFEFYRKLDGHQYRCKACNAEVVRAYKKKKQQKDFSDWVKGVSK